MSIGAAASTRLTAYLGMIVQAIEGSGLFEDVRLALDAYALDDLLKENARLPSARVLMLKSDPAPRPDGGLDFEMSIAVAVVAGRSGRANTQVASADMAAIGLVMDLVALVQRDPYFSLPKISAAKLAGIRTVVSEKSNEKAMAITLMQFDQCLLDLLPAQDIVHRAMDPAAPVTNITVNGDPLVTGSGAQP